MRPTCALTVLLLANGTCLAQTSVNLYGIVDVGLRAADGLAANNAPTPPGHTTAVTSGINQTSRWGIRGQEALGGGWKAVFRLEGGMNADTGTQA